MRLPDAVASRRRHQRHAVVDARACHKTPKIYCDKRTVPMAQDDFDYPKHENTKLLKQCRHKRTAPCHTNNRNHHAKSILYETAICIYSCRIATSVLVAYANVISLKHTVLHLDIFY